MALPKITDNQIKESGVQSLPDKLTGTAAENKKKFDQLVQNVVKQKYNALIDALEAGGGAKEIGANVNGIDATNIQGVLDALKTLIDDNKTSQDNINSGVQAGLDNVYTKGQTDVKIAAVQDDVDANESAQSAVNRSVQTALNNRYTIAQTDGKLDLKLDKTTGNELVKSISFNSDNGVFTITTLGGKTTTIDTMLEKLPVSFSIVGNKLRITADDGSYQEADLSSFIDTYTFEDTDTVDFSQSGKRISAAVKAGSIGKTHFNPEVMTEIENYAVRAENAEESAAASKNSAEASAASALNYKTIAEERAIEANSAKQTAVQQANDALASKNAAQASASGARNSASEALASQNAAAKSAENAANSETEAGKSASSAKVSETNSKTHADDASEAATLAESWAVGGTGLDYRGDEDTNNAKYYAEQAKQDAEDAQDHKEQAEKWAIGNGGGEDIPGAMNNAKYYSEQADLSRTVAIEKAAAAQESATAAGKSASDAAESAETASDKAERAREWATGWDNNDTPSPTNNAKYWAEVAKSNANLEQADWDENDKNMAGYVKNRTHYTEVVEGGTILPDYSVNTTAGWAIITGAGKSNIIPEQEYIVTWRNVEYRLTAKAGDYDTVLLGNPKYANGKDDGSCPFCFWDMTNSSCTFSFNAASGTSVLKVKGVSKETIHHLPAKYIKDMYHEEEAVEVLASTAATYNSIAKYFTLENALNLVEGAEYVVDINGTKIYCIAKKWIGELFGGISLGNQSLFPGETGYDTDTGEIFVVVDIPKAKEDGTTTYGVVICTGDEATELNIAVTKSAVIHKVPAKYLPENIGGSGADLLNENGIIKQEVLPEGYPYSEKSIKTLFPKTKLSSDFYSGGEGMLPDILDISIGDTCYIDWNGVVYKTHVQTFAGGGQVITAAGNIPALTGEGTPTDEPFFVAFLTPEQAEMMGGIGVQIMALDEAEELTIGISKEAENIAPIATKYMPVGYPSLVEEVVIIDKTSVSMGNNTLEYVNFPEKGVTYECVAESLAFEGGSMTLYAVANGHTQDLGDGNQTEVGVAINTLLGQDDNGENQYLFTSLFVYDEYVETLGGKCLVQYNNPTNDGMDATLSIKKPEVVKTMSPKMLPAVPAKVFDLTGAYYGAATSSPVSNNIPSVATNHWATLNKYVVDCSELLESAKTGPVRLRFRFKKSDDAEETIMDAIFTACWDENVPNDNPNSVMGYGLTLTSRYTQGIYGGSNYDIAFVVFSNAIRYNITNVDNSLAACNELLLKARTGQAWRLYVKPNRDLVCYNASTGKEVVLATAATEGTT